jgi:8-amino-7-oxononanoate synthase
LPLRVQGAGGAGASRLISGDYEAHRAAEKALASWVGSETALLFTSGYAANVGAISALAGPGDLVVSDELNHASIIDGCRLSKADVRVVPHNRAEAVAEALSLGGSRRRKWVVTESVFSMEGDVADVTALRAICDAHGAGLYVDEAHALGVVGLGGVGLCGSRSVAPDVLVGTLGKAVGLQGAFVAGPATLRRWLWNRARSFVFSTGCSPALAAELPARIERVRADEPARVHLREVAEALRAVVQEAGGRVGGAPSTAIVPWMLGAPDRAVRAARDLLELGVRAQAIRPPTVPPGTSRIRFTASSAVSPDELAKATGAIAAVVRQHR